MDPLSARSRMALRSVPTTYPTLACTMLYESLSENLLVAPPCLTHGRHGLPPLYRSDVPGSKNHGPRPLFCPGVPGEKNWQRLCPVWFSPENSPPQLLLVKNQQRLRPVGFPLGFAAGGRSKHRQRAKQRSQHLGGVGSKVCLSDRLCLAKQRRQHLGGGVGLEIGLPGILHAVAHHQPLLVGLPLVLRRARSKIGSASGAS